MRLIDVKKLNECLFIHKGKICPNRDIDNFPITMTVEDVKSAISKQPTAYDVDKVVEKLENRSKEYNSGVRLHGKPEEMLTDDAIEIVKAGGRDGN